MKKLFIFFVAALSLCACNTRKEQLAKEISSNDSLRSIVEQKENELNDLISTLNEVQDGFDAINAAEGRINVERQRGEGSNREMLRENLAEIQKSMQVNRELIESLRQQLKESSIYTSNLKTSLEQTINRLTQQLEEKTQEVAQLQKTLAEKNITIAEQTEEISNLTNNVRELNDNVRELDKQNTQRAQTVAQQDKELHTAYYVFGTKKELKEQRILADGEVLRSGNFAKDYFTKIDTRTTKVIHLYSKNATLRTSHPAGTYSLDKDANGQYTLRITDPDRFWSTSKYLVIVVK